MPDVTTTAEIRKELNKTVADPSIGDAIANSATLRRAGVGDFRVAVDDRELIEESDQTQAQLQTEFDQTQAILNSIKDAIDALSNRIDGSIITQTNALLKPLADIKEAIDNQGTVSNPLNVHEV